MSRINDGDFLKAVELIYDDTEHMIDDHKWDWAIATLVTWAKQNKEVGVKISAHELFDVVSGRILEAIRY